MKNNIKIIIIMIFALLFNTFAFANSAPTYWQGYPTTGVVAIDDNTPIEVLKENLVFDFTEEDYMYSPRAKVSATYEMKNSSNEDISVQMAFPFIEGINNLSQDSIVVTADGEMISYDVYIGDIVKNNDFNIEEIIKSITNKKYVANNFKEKEIGKLYRFKMPPVDEKVRFAVSFNFDYKKTKVIFSGFNSYEGNDDYVRVAASSIDEDRLLEIYVLGEDIDLDCKFYTDVNLKNELYKLNYNIIKEDKDIESYLIDFLKKYSSYYENIINSNISDIQLYNLYAEYLDKYLDESLGIFPIDDMMSVIRDNRIITLVYTVDFNENSTREVSVSYKTNGTMDRRETVKPQYTYDYILNPAKKWKEFENLNIKIITPDRAPYVINSSIELKKEDNNVYKAFLEKLPEEDFFFTLYSNEKITLSDSIEGYLHRNFGYFTPIVVAFILLIIIVITVSVIVRAYKKRRLKN